MTESEIAPDKKAFGKPCDAASLLRVIDTLRDKSRLAFKSSQFAQRPTFAFALCDRLLIPAGKHAAAPYYVERGAGNTLASGVLWQTCFGVVGSPIVGDPRALHTRRPFGLVVPIRRTTHSPFPLVQSFADTSWPKDGVFGLFQTAWDASAGVWTTDDTEEVMLRHSTALNDESSAGIYHLTHVNRHLASRLFERLRVALRSPRSVMCPRARLGGRLHHEGCPPTGIERHRPFLARGPRPCQLVNTLRPTRQGERLKLDDLKFAQTNGDMSRRGGRCVVDSDHMVPAARAYFRKGMERLRQPSFWKAADSEDAYRPSNGLWAPQRRAVAVCLAYLGARSAQSTSETALVKMPTGTGKTAVIATLACALPDVRRTLIITPQRALVDQLLDDVRWRFWSNFGMVRRRRCHRTSTRRPASTTTSVKSGLAPFGFFPVRRLLSAKQGQTPDR